jgi:VanZ family protein
VYKPKYIHLTIIYILIISLLSHTPNDNLPQSDIGFSNMDKIFHFVEFFILGLLIKFSLYEREISSQKVIVFTTIIFGFSLACIDELHQSFIRGRVCSVEDLLFDFLGISLSFFNYKNFF